MCAQEMYEPGIYDSMHPLDLSWHTLISNGSYRGDNIPVPVFWSHDSYNCSKIEKQDTKEKDMCSLSYGVKSIIISPARLLSVKLALQAAEPQASVPTFRDPEDSAKPR